MDKTSIANLALGALGEARIQNLNDNNSRARACNARLDNVITTVFQLPVGCIKVVEVDPVSRYQVEQKNILSNEKTLNVLYVGNPTDINMLDSLLAEAIAMKLALEICETLTSKQGLKQEMMQRYVISLQEARAANSHDKTPEHRERSSFLDAKRGRHSVPHRTFNTPSQGYEANQHDYSIGS